MTMDAERATKGLWLSDELLRTPFKANFGEYPFHALRCITLVGP